MRDELPHISQIMAPSNIAIAAAPATSFINLWISTSQANTSAIILPYLGTGKATSSTDFELLAKSRS